MSDAIESLEEVNRLVASLTAEASSGRSKLVPVERVLPLARSLATRYFETIRTQLGGVANRAGLVEEIDFVVQQLLQLATDRREKNAYLGQLNELRPYLLEATIDLMKSKGNPTLVLSDTERGILNTLARLLPASAAAYEQALRDISQGTRVSWRGTASELREVLREVIDHLAPDQQVMAGPAFKLETGQSGPTQKQKVRFILRARRGNSAEVNVAEGALNTVEEAVSSLARSAYQLGSVSTHVGAGAKEIRSMKRYVDALLAQLLEVG